MREKGEKGRHVEHEDHAEVGAAGAQGFETGLRGRESKDRPEDQSIRHTDEHDVQAGGEKSCCQPIPDIGFYVGAGQAGDAHVLTVGVGHDVVSAVRQPLQEEDGWEHDAEPPDNGSHSYFPNHRGG